APRTQTALAVAGVLPEMPIAPWRSVTRLRMIVGDPEPAVGENRAISPARTATVKHRAQTIFAAVNAGIFSGTLFDSLHKGNSLPDAHRTAAIVIVHFEIEHEQNARTVFFFVGRGIHNWMRRSHDGKEMVGLLDRIRPIAEMIRAPQHTGPHCLELAFAVAPVALVFWKTRFVDHAKNAFAFHGDK